MRRPTFRSVDGDQSPESVAADISSAVASVVGGTVIVCRSDAEIARMRTANQLVADVLEALVGGRRRAG